MSFDQIVQKTLCPFARTSKMGPPLTVASADVERELREHRTAIADFFRTARADELDGMVITFEDETLGASLDSLTRLTKRFFETLCALYPGVYIQDSPRPDETWYAMIEGERFFVVSFAPCYPEHSPRHNHGSPHTYFLLQPASTFERNAEAIDRRRERIHRAFTAVGRPYDAPLANVENDMFKSVMPIEPIDRHIPWWEAGDGAMKKAG
ncbi:YqcI/YcgG family protein [Streptomyces vilmorinianum]|uniref:YqcI/YcgG family protein n=1 Tax=Streptomyces vilmorinianum TaxID=3051092 RepID=UPI0010FBADBE|nr:YqcI/YcgG family protein [Streptomyces vilmorinianum]